MQFYQAIRTLITGSDSTLTTEAVAMLAFAVVFLIVGLYRVVEFQGVPMQKKTRAFLIFLHVLGCLTFACALVFSVINLVEDERKIMFGLFIFAMVCFAPGQFTIGIKRRAMLP